MKERGMSLHMVETFGKMFRFIKKKCIFVAKVYSI